MPEKERDILYGKNTIRLANIFGIPKEVLYKYYDSLKDNKIVKINEIYNNMTTNNEVIKADSKLAAEEKPRESSKDKQIDQSNKTIFKKAIDKMKEFFKKIRAPKFK